MLLHDPDFDPSLLGYPRSVAETWLTSYRQLPLESRWIFDILCWFAPEPIPERIVSIWPEQTLALFPNEVAQAIQQKARRVMIPLYDFSLAEKPIGSQRLFKMHNLVQEVGRLWQRKEPRDPSPRRIAQEIIEHDFIRPNKLGNQTHNIIRDLQQISPHVGHLLTDISILTGQPLFASRLYRALAELAQASGKLGEGSHLAARAIDLAKACASADDSYALKTMGVH